MELSRKSKLARWAYRFDSYRPPYQTTLCALFWRALLLTPLQYALLTVVPGLILSVIIMEVWVNPYEFLLGVGVFVASVTFVIVVFDICDYFRYRGQDTVLVQAIKGIKGKYCPIIYFKD